MESRGKAFPTGQKRCTDAYGSPDLSTRGDVYVGPLIGRKSGLRKDDLVEMVIDARSVKSEETNVISGMLISTGGVPSQMKMAGFAHSLVM